MSGLTFDTESFMSETALAEKFSELALREELSDIADDLIRISSNLAPIAVGTLRKSHSFKIGATPKGYSVTVSFSAIEEGGSGTFNYALWTHEMSYNLGKRSAASMGTDGYRVGNKYLERPLLGESNKYLKWLGDAVKRSVER